MWIRLTPLEIIQNNISQIQLMNIVTKNTRLSIVLASVWGQDHLLLKMLHVIIIEITNIKHSILIWSWQFHEATWSVPLHLPGNQMM